MMIHVWLIYKKGEPRVYTRTTEPPEDLADKWRSEGFRIYRGDFVLPEEDDTPTDGFPMRSVVELTDGTQSS